MAKLPCEFDRNSDRPDISIGTDDYHTPLWLLVALEGRCWSERLIYEDVLISGFGKFCVNKKRKRRGRNSATGEDMMLAQRRVVTFKCSGRLRDRINKSQ